MPHSVQCGDQAVDAGVELHAISMTHTSNHRPRRDDDHVGEAEMELGATFSNRAELIANAFFGSVAELGSYGSRARLRRAGPDCGRRQGAVLAGPNEQDTSSSTRTQLPRTDEPRV
jgi:hypothetical protein